MTSIVHSFPSCVRANQRAPILSKLSDVDAQRFDLETDTERGSEVSAAPTEEGTRWSVIQNPILRCHSIEAHARVQAELLRTSSPVIREAIKAGTLRVDAAVYDWRPEPCRWCDHLVLTAVRHWRAHSLK